MTTASDDPFARTATATAMPSVPRAPHAVAAGHRLVKYASLSAPSRAEPRRAEDPTHRRVVVELHHHTVLVQPGLGPDLDVDKLGLTARSRSRRVVAATP